LKIFEVLVLIALTAETASWHLIVTQLSRSGGGAVERDLA
jgi:hypothetical protein